MAPRINGEVFGASFFDKAYLGQAAILPLVVPGMFVSWSEESLGGF